ncbi:hypothetical protein Y032_0031g2356 [Ancylostoma ceylanicum]|uniref:Uncharacterized protein n=1 Tax=Ancylostoma ceylanicum TaxID=53326 RepID=A0A016UPC7_9BILA|nr:hypothetical protein Y032_0031g2356 [Ancylostoma ceylanicum]
MAIVSTYLISNSLHLVLTLLEFGKASILFEEFDSFHASTLYTTMGDTVSGKNESLHLRRVWVQFYIPILSPILNLNSHKRSNNWRTKMWTEEKELFDSVENISDFGLLAFAAEFAWCENSKNLEK